MKTIDPDVRRILMKRLESVIIRRSDQLVFPVEASAGDGLERYNVGIPENLIQLSKEKKSIELSAQAFELAHELVNKLVPRPRSPSFR